MYNDEPRGRGNQPGIPSEHRIEAKVSTIGPLEPFNNADVGAWLLGVGDSLLFRAFFVSSRVLRLAHPEQRG